MRVLAILMVFVLLIGSCRFPKFKDPNEKKISIPDYAVVFNEIDNFATLTINGEEVFVNETLLRSADDPVVIDIKSHLKPGDNSIQIQLMDTPRGQCLTNEWNINYDIYGNGELFDYWQQRNEPGDNCADEIKVSKEYTMTVSSPL